MKMDDETREFIEMSGSQVGLFNITLALLYLLEKKGVLTKAEIYNMIDTRAFEVIKGQSADDIDGTMRDQVSFAVEQAMAAEMKRMKMLFYD